MTAGTFELRSSPIALRIDRFEGPQAFLHCGEDLGRPLEDVQDPSSGWVAISGTLRVSMNQRRSSTRVRLDDLILRSVKSGAQVRSTRRVTLDAKVVNGIGG